MHIARAVGIGVVCFLATLVVNGVIARVIVGWAPPTEYCLLYSILSDTATTHSNR